ncbi:MAG: DUF447 domain-containing protein [Candidatus Hydrothermarchaeales archaeon]
MEITDEMERLGFMEGTISECIVTTYNEDGSPNAAPMGILREGKFVVMKIHTFSDTYRNLLREKACILNILFDSVLFLKSAIMGQGKGERELEVGLEEVRNAEHVKAPYITNANAYIELLLSSHKELEKRDRYGRARISLVKCEIKSINVIKKHPVVINRGLYAAIELAILLSRGERKEARRYLEIMQKTLDKGEYNRIEKLLEGRL